jgi:hypothetical protein
MHIAAPLTTVFRDLECVESIYVYIPDYYQGYDVDNV